MLKLKDKFQIIFKLNLIKLNNFIIIHKNKLKSFILVYLFIFNFSLCTKYESGYEQFQLAILIYSGKDFLQLADTPYSLMTIFSNENGAADLDGPKNNASFVNLSSIQFYNSKLYLLDNTRNIYPKLKTYNLTTNEITTIGALSTDNRPIKDMALTSDGYFFLAYDKIFYYSSFAEIATGIPTQTVTFTFNQNEYSQLSKIKVDTLRQYLYILNNCKIYKISYVNLPANVTLSSSFFTYPGCTFGVTSDLDASIDNFAIDTNETMYICKNINLQKKSISGSLTTIYSNDNIQTYADLSCYINNNDIFFVGNNFNVGAFRSQFSTNRLYKINLSTLKVNLLAGGGYSRSGSTKDGIGTFSNFQSISTMTFTPDGNFYFLDNFIDYNTVNKVTIQKIRKASKL